jgi:hypothetical protein
MSASLPSSVPACSFQYFSECSETSLYKGLLMTRLIQNWILNYCILIIQLDTKFNEIL